MARCLIVLLSLLLIASGCGRSGDVDRGRRVKLFDLSIWGENANGTDRRFRGTCPEGSFTVDFRAGKEITIQSKSHLVASLDAEEAVIACTDAHVERPRRAQGLPYIARNVARVNRSTRLMCITTKRVGILVKARYKFHDTFAGGSIVAWTPRVPQRRWGRALLAVSFEDGQDSGLTYDRSRCRISER